MGGYRAERIAERIHQELAARLPRLKDPRLAEISITSVKVTRDLRRAVVEYLPLGGGEVTDDLEEALRDAARHLRGPVGRALGIHHAPELHFERDRHTEAALRVTALIDRISKSRTAEGEGGPLDLEETDEPAPETDAGDEEEP